MKEELKEKAKEWRKNYTPMGITCIERDGVVIETQSEATKIIENPNPFRIKDGWYELYLRDLDNAYMAGAIENGIQWHKLYENPNDLPKKEGPYWVCLRDGRYKDDGSIEWTSKPLCMTGVWRDGVFGYGGGPPVIAWCELPQFKE